MFKKIIIFGNIISFFFLFPSTLSAELSNYNYKIIQIAFMNGYINALEADIDTIKSLKENSGKLKNYSTLAVNRYMEKISELNRTNPEVTEGLKGHLTGSKSEVWY